MEEKAPYEPLIYDYALSEQLFVQNPFDYIICGAHINLRKKEFFLAIQKKVDSSLEKGIEFDDLAVVLKIFYDSNIKQKSISFSLDPVYELENTKNPMQEKVFWPDKSNDLRILESTNMGEELFEADFLMKQICQGQEVISLDPLETNKFEFPQEWKDKGLHPLYEYFPKNSEEIKKEGDRRRFWIETEFIESFLSSDEQRFETSSVLLNQCKMKVSARKLAKNEEGKYIDALVQDSNDPGFLIVLLYFSRNISFCLAFNPGQVTLTINWFNLNNNLFGRYRLIVITN